MGGEGLVHIIIELRKVMCIVLVPCYFSKTINFNHIIFEEYKCSEFVKTDHMRSTAIVDNLKTKGTQ